MVRPGADKAIKDLSSYRENTLPMPHYPVPCCRRTTAGPTSVTTTWTSAGGAYAAGRVAQMTKPGSTWAVWDEWDVTSAIQGFAANPATNLGFLLMTESPSNTGHDYVQCDTVAAATLRPKLVVTYTGGVSDRARR